MKSRQKALKIDGGNGLWMRVYHRKDKTCYLCNFCPMGCNGLLPKLEQLLNIEEVAMFQEVDMAFIITSKGRGVPVVDLADFLNSIINQNIKS
jgi:hypothetical protein